MVNAQAVKIRINNNYKLPQEFIYSMSDTTIFILSLSIASTAIIGLARFGKMDISYHPFVYYACLATLIEVVDYILVEKGMYDAFCLLTNIYSFAEFFLLSLLFHNWGLFKRKKKVFATIISFFFLLWFVTLFTRGYTKMNYTFFIIMSFIIIFFSISSFNRMIVDDRKNIFTNAKFWICIGIVIFYTYFILVNTARLSFFNTHLTKHFTDSLFSIRIYSNLLVNLLYAIAVIWVPRKKNIMTLF